MCVGQHIKQYPSILPELDKLGHFVGHHTYSHPYMTTLLVTGQRSMILEEMRTTDELIRKLIPNKPVYFRAPYGYWYADHSKLLNREFEQSHNYQEPYFWDINADDYRFWLINSNLIYIGKIL